MARNGQDSIKLGKRTQEMLLLATQDPGIFPAFISSFPFKRVGSCIDRQRLLLKLWPSENYRNPVTVDLPLTHRRTNALTTISKLL